MKIAVCFEVDAVLYASTRKISNFGELKFVSREELNKIRLKIKLEHNHDIMFNFD